MAHQGRYPRRVTNSLRKFVVIDRDMGCIRERSAGGSIKSRPMRAGELSVGGFTIPIVDWHLHADDETAFQSTPKQTTGFIDTSVTLDIEWEPL